MKNKNITLVLILISLFIFMPSEVKAEADDYCYYNVNDITDSSAILSFKCNQGNGRNDSGYQGMESVTLYNSDCNTLKDGKKIKTKTWKSFDADHDNITFDNLTSGKCYFASFNVRGSGTNAEKDIPYIVFQAGSGKILKHSAESKNSKFNQSLTVDEADKGTGDYNYTPESIGKVTTADPKQNRMTICDQELKKDLRKYWNWFTIIGPIALIILVSLDFAKAIISSNADAMKKSSSNAIKRTAAVIILLMTPWILKIIFEIVGLEEYICF